jgi:hypothetical protein
VIRKYCALRNVAHLPLERYLRAMITRRALPLAVAAAALACAPAAAARATAPPNVCKLIPAASVKAIPGTGSACSETPALQAPGGRQYSGTWKGSTPKGTIVEITISVYSDTGFLARARQNLKQGLPTTPASKLTGVGQAAWYASGEPGTGVHVAKGKEIAYIVVTTTGKKAWSKAQVVTLAMAVAAKL